MKKIVKIFVVIILCMLSFKLNIKADDNILVETISVSSDKNVIYTNETLQMNATVTPDNASNKEIVWSVKSGSGNASISDDGILTPLQPGLVTVRAVSTDDSGVYGQKQINIEQLYVEELEFQNPVTSVERQVGTSTYSLKITPSDAYNRKITWSVIKGTGDGTIDEYGNFIGTKTGTVTIRATADDRGSVYKDLEVNVTPLLVRSVTIIGNDKLNVGDKEIYIASLNPIDPDDKSITWSIKSGSEYATIDENGLVEAKGVGTVQIKAVSSNGEANTFSISIVSENEPIKAIVTANDYNIFYGRGSTTVYARVYPSTEKISNISWSRGNANSFCDNYTTITGRNYISDYVDSVDVSTSCYLDTTLYITANITTESGKKVSGYVAINLSSSSSSMSGSHVNTINTSDSKIMEVGDISKIDATFSPNIKDEVLYNISNNKVAHVDLNGNVYAKSKGYATIDIYSKYNNVIASIPISVVDDKSEPLKAMEIEISGNDIVERESSSKYTASVYPINAVNKEVEWSVTNLDGSATIDQNGNLYATSDGQVSIKATAKDGSGVYKVKVVTIQRTYVESITLSGDSEVERLGNMIYVPNVLPIHAFSKNVFWSIENVTGEATIDQGGFFHANKVGKVIVRARATDGSGVYGEKEVNIYPIYIKDMAIDGSNAVVIGKNVQYTANIVNNADDKSVTWSVENGTGSATIDQNGLLTPVTAGTVTIKVRANDDAHYEVAKVVNIKNKGELEAIVIKAPSQYINNAASMTLSLMSYPGNIELNNVSWTSSDNNIAMIDDNGRLATGNTIGEVTITATVGDVSDSIKIYVGYERIELNKTKEVEVLFTSLKSGTFTVTDPSIIRIDSFGTTQVVSSYYQNGTYVGSATYYGYKLNITGLNVGTTTFKLVSSSGTILAIRYVNVYASDTNVYRFDTSDFDLEVGKTKKISVNNISNNKVFYTTTNDSVISVDENGIVTAHKNGNAKIQAYIKEKNITLSLNVNAVTYASDIELSTNTINLNTENHNYQIEYNVLPANATNKEVTFTSSNSNVVIVNENGYVSAVDNGTATITVKTKDGKQSKNINVVVSNYIKCESVKLLEDNPLKISSSSSSYKLKYELLPNGCASEGVKYSVSDNKVLSVDENGYIKGLKAGEATVTITSDTGKTDSIKVNVDNYIKLNGFNINDEDIHLSTNGKLPKEYQINYQLTPANATYKKINWTSSNSEVATVDNNGNITAKNIGETIITGIAEEGSIESTVNVKVVYGYDTINYYKVSRDSSASKQLLKSVKLYYGEELDLSYADYLSDGCAFEGWYREFYSDSNLSWTGYYGHFYNNINDMSIENKYDNSAYELYLYERYKSIEEFKINSAQIEEDVLTINFSITPKDAVHQNSLANNISLENFTLLDNNYDGNYNLDSYYIKLKINDDGNNDHNGNSYVGFYDNASLYYGLTYVNINNKYYKWNNDLYNNNLNFATTDIYNDIQSRKITVTANTNYKIGYILYEYNDGQDTYKSSNIINNDSFIISGLKNSGTYMIRYYLIDVENGEYYPIDSYYYYYHNYLIPEFKLVSKAFGSVSLVLTKNYENYDYIEVYRSELSDKDYQYIGRIDKGSDTYVDSNLPYKSFYYGVRGVLASGESTKYSYVYWDYRKSGSPYAKIENMQITFLSPTKVKLSWEKISGATGYDIMMGTDGSSYSGIKTIKGNSTTSYTYSKLKNNKKYYFMVEPVKDTKKNYYFGSGNSVMIITGPKATKISASKYNYNTIKINISGSSGAKTYKVYRSTSKTKGFSLVGETENIGSYYDTNLIPGKTYYYKVSACNDYTCSSYSKVVSSKTSLGTPSIKLSSTLDKQVRINYNSIEGAVGYEIYSSTYKNKKFKLIATVNDLNYLDIIPLNKAYYYKVRAYLVINGKKYYSSYSKVVSIKVTISKPIITLLKSDSRISISYNAVSGATGYEIYRSTNKKKGYKLITSTEELSYIEEELPIKTYYYKVRAYRYINGKKYYSDYSAIKSIK